MYLCILPHLGLRYYFQGMLLLPFQFLWQKTLNISTDTAYENKNKQYI